MPELIFNGERPWVALIPQKLLPRSIAKMIPITPKAVIIFLSTITFCCQAFETSGIPEYADGSYDYPEVEERSFHKAKKTKLAPLIEKKNWFLSLFNKNHQPEPEPPVQTLAPVVNYPIWKIHKYKGIEFYPVQVIDVPNYYQPMMFAAPPEPVRTPHSEYGPPKIEYEPPQFVDSQETAKTPLATHQELPMLSHGEKFKAFLSLLKTHKNLIWKIKDLKSWKLGPMQAPTPIVYPLNYAVELPEVAEFQVKGLENLNVQIPELPPISFPYYASTITTEPYVTVNYANPLPFNSPVNYEPPVRAPATYYGAPPLLDSYGNPLPPDAYSSEPSNQILTIAVPGTASQMQSDISLRPPSAASEISFAPTSLESKPQLAKEAAAGKVVKEAIKNSMMLAEKESSGSQDKNRNPAEKETH